jgi:trimethylamine:corrinoid methyltransferase-like protein
MDPRSGDYYSGAVENGVFGAAATEMARYYNLPAESSGFSTGHCEPSIQSGYERALNGLMPTLSWPDILVGPGLLGGAMVLSLEQFLIDVEMFRMCRKAHSGMVSTDEKWLDGVISMVGPGGHFTAEESTVEAIRAGEWYIGDMGVHEPYEIWVQRGRPDLTEKLRSSIDHMLRGYESLPLSSEEEKELAKLQKSASL